ncbi:MAG TPA: ankyrin repeat domain-containing protein [Bacilli bacterium]|nr:ankyrin repeat domain-containing protein [Bacilli bacterium]
MTQEVAKTQEFLQAVGKGEVETVRRMLEASPELLQLRVKTGQSPVLTAIYHGQQQALQVLLDAGVELDVFEAAAVGDAARVRELVGAESALVEAFGNDGFTALGLAAFLGHEEIVEYLLEQGAPVNEASRNPFQVMPLHSAVARGSVRIAEMLLQAGAQVNAKQESGFTPMHEAALQGNVEMANLLLAHGADASLRKDDGETPLDVALAKDKQEVVELLKG